MKKVIFVTCHGVELNLKQGYTFRFNQSVMKLVPAIYRSAIIPHEFVWHDLVNERQEKTWEMEKDLGSARLRKIAIKVSCDILWYRASRKLTGASDIYTQIHKKLAFEINLLRKEHGEDSSVVLHGHSLGSCIAFDHCWETEARIDGLFTTGSPLTKYSGMYEDWGRLPLYPLQFWVNFVTWRDLVCSSFERHPSKELREKVENVRIGSWNPLNFSILRRHTLYWKSSQVHEKMANHLQALILKLNA